MNKQRKGIEGTAIFMALLMTTIVAAIAVTLARTQQIEIRRTQMMVTSEQAYLSAQGVVYWAIGALQKDMQTPIAATSWPLILPATPIEDGQGKIMGQLQDAEGLLNINSIQFSGGTGGAQNADTSGAGGANSTSNSDSASVFKRLLSLLNLKTSPDQQTSLVAAIADWVGSGKTAQQGGSAGSGSTPSSMPQGQSSPQSSQPGAPPGASGPPPPPPMPQGQNLPQSSEPSSPPPVLGLPPPPGFRPPGGGGASPDAGSNGGPGSGPPLSPPGSMGQPPGSPGSMGQPPGSPGSMEQPPGSPGQSPGSPGQPGGQSQGQASNQPQAPNLDPQYAKMSPPYQAPHNPVLSISELRTVSGMTPDIYNALEPYLVALPDATTSINTAHAPPMILKAMNAQPNSQASSQGSEAPKSQYFLVRADVFLQDQHLVLYCMLFRSNDKQKPGIKVLWQSLRTQ